MSVQTEINRLTSAKEDIKIAIESKGVTVPEDVKLDGIAALIESITTGGGATNLHTVTTNCENASAVVEYFRNLRPDGCLDMLVVLKPKESITAFSKMTNGQLLTLSLNGTKAAYTRWYSSALNVQTTFTTSYTCKSFVGDEYYIFPVY